MRRYLGTILLFAAAAASLSLSGCIWYRHWQIRREVQEVKKDVQEMKGGWGFRE